MSDVAGLPCDAARIARFGLTTRESQIIRAIANGASNVDVSKELGISNYTVKNYLRRIFAKTGVSSRLALMFFAVEYGFTVGHLTRDNSI